MQFFYYFSGLTKCSEQLFRLRSGSKIILLCSLVFCWLQTIDSLQAQAMLFESGPLITSIGTSPGGNHTSMLQNTTLSMNIIGFNANYNASASTGLADDFEIPEDKVWYIDEFMVFGYQTGSTTSSTFTAIYIQVWEGSPLEPGSTVVFGDTFTNRISSTSFSGIYRTTQTAGFGNTDRPVMQIVAEAGVLLPAGEYWLEYRLVGSTASGPFCAPITIMGQTTTGNALQYNASDGFYPLIDYSASTGLGTQTPQGIPFRVYGIEATILETDSVHVEHVICHGSSSGSIEVMMTGGIQPYSFSWSHGANSALVSGLEAGEYHVVVTDSIGQEVDISFNVTEPEAIEVEVASVIHATCHGDNDGEVTIEVSGGNAPYTVAWDENSGNQTGFTASDLAAGTYFATITDDTGCEAEMMVIIDQPDPLEPLTIIGETLVTHGDTVVYTVDAPEGWALEWLAGGGTILSGQGTAEVLVEWGTPGTAFISLNAVNPEGCDVISTSGITIQEVVSVTAPELGTFTLHPNPAMNMINIRTTRPGDYTFRLITTDGKQVITGQFSGTERSISLEGLPAGVFMLSMQDDTGRVFTKPLMIQ